MTEGGVDPFPGLPEDLPGHVAEHDGEVTVAEVDARGQTGAASEADGRAAAARSGHGGHDLPNGSSNPAVFDPTFVYSPSNKYWGDLIPGGDTLGLSFNGSAQIAKNWTTAGIATFTGPRCGAMTPAEFYDGILAATILFLAALSGIDSSLYEATAVDGSSRWRQIWHVTLPGLRGVIILLLILRLGDSLSVGFEQIILQQRAVGIDASEVIDTYVFNHGVVGNAWGEATAVGLVKGVIGTLLVLGANKLAHVFGEQGVYKA